MPIIYLKHPIHGTKVATIDAEADYDEAQGWKRYDLNTQSEVVAEVFVELEEVIAAPVNTLEVKRRRKSI